jgi:DNA polymerase III subunit delta
MDAIAKKILNDLKKRKYAPVYVLQGEETYYIDLIANFIESNVLSESEKSFNQVILYGKESPVSTILNHAKRFPMMSEYQVVIVREAQDIPDLQKEMGTKMMLDYLSRPSASTVLVLCHMHKTLDKRRELGKKVDQLAISAVFKKAYENQLGDFILEYASEKGMVMEDQAVRTLQEYVGNDLQRLANEIDKIGIGSGGTAITAERVMQAVGISREYNIFELQKALVSRDIFQAAKIINYFEGNTRKNPMIPAVAYLFYFFSKLLAATTVPGMDEKEMISLLKISPFAIRDYVKALDYYSIQQIIAAIRLIKEADLKLKGVNNGSADEGQIFRELVFRLLG